MKTNFLVRIFIYLGSIGLSLGLLLFFISSVWISHEAKNLCLFARQQYQSTDCVAALSLLLEDQSIDYKSRNQAIWALGQIGDNRALPLLQKYYTGTIPAREPLDQMISQYELKKALYQLNGGVNITGWLWRSQIKDL